MIRDLIFIIIGSFVGWNFPQPVVAASIQRRIVRKYRQLIGKDTDREDVKAKAKAKQQASAERATKESDDKPLG